ncbi:Uncharacterized protein C23A1.18c [Taphrina deformans PYCC 5710]|uniref:Uncharacterized protein C23A1.18c n=1 Tax=Taphrina deformans (strain PYCC 5710 / ATCC 11124 / CBS 356.35 / IMI 108563 / JCM 9778 / NBRC 8474) TaxID=1097556 RepID=R4X6W0_TAPDE|nr:Uncharacterized protein C23A1.18c [Taphrina deformans PYCC 5710]|eukprot:CCG80957.1 Uncharacterized protein C23A1.18c [Taphrina deformans PYCC 5710]
MALPPNIKSSSTHDLHPLSPSIRTSKASQNIGDWGLKRNLPRLRTSNITISDIDTQEHQTPFSSSNKYTKVVERWQEMGIPVRTQLPPRQYTQQPEYHASLPENINRGIYLGSVSKSDLNRLVIKARKSRASFLASQGKNKPSVYSAQVLSDIKKKAREYLGIISQPKRGFTVQRNGGLGYHPHGALSLVNTPKGPQERTVSARVLQSGRNTTLVGLGGILSELKQRNDNVSGRRQGRANTIKIYNGEMEMTHNGALNVSVEDVRPNAFDRQRELGSIAFADFDRRDSFIGEEAFTDEEMEPSEKSLSESKTRKSSALDNLERLIASSPVSQERNEKD